MYVHCFFPPSECSTSNNDVNIFSMHTNCEIRSAKPSTHCLLNKMSRLSSERTHTFVQMQSSQEAFSSQSPTTFNTRRTLLPNRQDYTLGRKRDEHDTAMQNWTVELGNKKEEDICTLRQENKPHKLLLPPSQTAAMVQSDTYHHSRKQSRASISYSSTSSGRTRRLKEYHYSSSEQDDDTTGHHVGVRYLTLLLSEREKGPKNRGTTSFKLSNPEFDRIMS